MWFIYWAKVNSDTRITDKGLEHLKGLVSLEELSLASTTVTDVGLEHLKEFRHLRGLNLFNTQVTYEAEKRFQQALPNCIIAH